MVFKVKPVNVSNPFPEVISIAKLRCDGDLPVCTYITVILKTAVEDSVSAQVLCLQAVTATAVVTKLVKCEAVATSMDSSACGATAEVNCRF